MRSTRLSTLVACSRHHGQACRERKRMLLWSPLRECFFGPLPKKNGGFLLD
uniref:Uncharacterized protein n=1 Tax=Triticum urartu TaxID=4572 RepID=A0A8R7Q516_TRIUA